MVGGRSAPRVALLLLLTFAAGVAGGVALDRYALDPATPEGGADRPAIERFADELGLTAEQRRAIDPILRETRSRLTAVFDEVRPHYRAVVDSARSHIEAVLTPEQVTRYREILEAEERARREREKDSGKEKRGMTDADTVSEER